MADLLFALVDSIGVGVIARFEPAPGVEEIPLYVEGDSEAAMDAKAAQEEFLAAVENAAANQPACLLWGGRQHQYR